MASCQRCAPPHRRRAVAADVRHLGRNTRFRSFPAAEQGMKARVRSETFADHYSLARQFYISQTETEQAQIASAFKFELSKVQTVAIRSRIARLGSFSMGSKVARSEPLWPME
jgi:catalase